jgi:hypothetical protein
MRTTNPDLAAGLADHIWSFRELLTAKLLANHSQTSLTKFDDCWGAVCPNNHQISLVFRSQCVSPIKVLAAEHRLEVSRLYRI